MKWWLLDTGPIVAFLDPGDAEHDRVSAILEAFTGRLATTTAVVVEAMHFVGIVPTGPALLVEFLLTSRTDIHECTSLESLTDAAALMDKYRDTPMDFADATLVLLAERLRTVRICTLDRRGFRTYRTRRRKSFEIVLDD
jgi:predicted nucleic acid-binding protein